MPEPTEQPTQPTAAPEQAAERETPILCTHEIADALRTDHAQSVERYGTDDPILVGARWQMERVRKHLRQKMDELQRQVDELEKRGSTNPNLTESKAIQSLVECAKVIDQALFLSRLTTELS